MYKLIIPFLAAGLALAAADKPKAKSSGGGGGGVAEKPKVVKQQKANPGNPGDAKSMNKSEGKKGR